MSDEKFFETPTKKTKLPLFMIERNKKIKGEYGRPDRWEKMPPQPYLQVAHRLVWFREEHPDWTISTREIFSDEKTSVFECVILTPEGRVIATGHKKETIAGFGDFMEKAETGSVGRALALCGFGTQFATDLDEGDRIVDSPVATLRDEQPTIVPAPPPAPPAAVMPPPMEDSRAALVNEFVRIGGVKGMKVQKELAAYASEILGRDVGKSLSAIKALSEEDLKAIVDRGLADIAQPLVPVDAVARLEESWTDTSSTT
jgi:hypothetical protein